MKPAKSPLLPASQSMEKIVAVALRKSDPGQAPMLAWPLACGSSVAARTQAIDCAEGILRVQVPDSGWKHELQVFAPRYLATLNKYLRQKISRIEFVVESARRAPRPSKDAMTQPRKLAR